MTLDWTTVVLEIVNFLVLVWILRHFLYRPVLRVVEQRRAAVAAELADADERRARAEALREQYENRLAEWQQARQHAREALTQELEQKRKRAMVELRAELAAEREREHVVAEREAHELETGRTSAAIALGARFATRLIEDFAGPELEARIVARVITELEQLPEARRAALRHAVVDGHAEVELTSAHELDEAQRHRLAEALREALDCTVHCRFVEQPDLIAGVRLVIGGWSVEANLRDELAGFAALADEHA